ncbi:MAG TPA: glycosyltransferase family 39 protein [Actinomycetota bacterium]|nr:glycosyltransferase family 39 protein [Actinomycetota bacterium]
MLGFIVAVSFALRAIGSRHGLPVIYNPDEYWHYVWVAVGFFENGYDPGYFFNPPAFSYLLHAVFWVTLGGGANVQATHAQHPETIFFIARLTTAVLGCVGVWLMYLAGARLFGRRTGLIAAAITAVAPLVVYQAHLAVNDVPMLVPVALSLFGSAGVLRKGRTVDYLIAGAAVGLAAATKYTAGIVLLPLIGAAVVQFGKEKKPALRGLGIALIASAGGFFVGNPFAVLNFSAFWEQFGGLPTSPSEGSRKLGEAETNGIRYYLWVLTWGIGWIPSLAAAAGSWLLVRKDRAAAALLLPGPILFILFTGSLLRYFGRYLMPVFPMVILVAAYAMYRGISFATRKRPQARMALVVVFGLALLGQSFVRSVHSTFVLTRSDTRNATLDWLAENVEPGTRMQVEPTARNGWILAPAWKYEGDLKMLGLHPVIARMKGVPQSELEWVPEDEYVAQLEPSLIDAYIDQGICWVVTENSTSGRAGAEPKRVPDAIDYYESLEERGEVVYEVSPYDSPTDTVDFKFDLVAAYYYFEFHRPGAKMTVYRLTEGSCEG